MEQENLKQEIKEISLIVSWREIARHYFDKPSSWLYDKLDGTDDFTEKEKEQLKGALYDVAERIRKVADRI